MVRDISPMTQPVIGWAFSLNKGARRHERRGSFWFLGLRRSWESNQEHFEKNQFFLTPPASGIEPGTFSNVQ